MALVSITFTIKRITKKTKVNAIIFPNSISTLPEERQVCVMKILMGYSFEEYKSDCFTGHWDKSKWGKSAFGP